MYASGLIKVILIYIGLHKPLILAIKYFYIKHFLYIYIVCVHIYITKEWFGKWLVMSIEDSNQPIISNLA